MKSFKQPNKEKVREYLAHRRSEHRPPPDPAQIRRELGWDLVEMERNRRSK